MKIKGIMYKQMPSPVDIYAGLRCPHCNEPIEPECEKCGGHCIELTVLGQVNTVFECGKCKKGFVVMEIVTREFVVLKGDEQDDNKRREAENH